MPKSLFASKPIPTDPPRDRGGGFSDWKSLDGAYRTWFATQPKHDAWNPRDPQTPIWIFRGMGNVNYELKTNLERAFDEFNTPADQRLNCEKCLIHDFRRRVRNLTLNLPPDEDNLAWLALMRHWGAPTRLLDWTYSFWVAVYFALEGPLEYKRNGVVRPAIVWAIDRKGLADRFDKVIGSEPEAKLKKVVPYMRLKETFDTVFFGTTRLVYPGNPFSFGERQVVQQGFFLAPGNLEYSFEQNLMAMVNDDEDYK